MTIVVDWDVKQQNKQNVSIKRIWDTKTADPRQLSPKQQFTVEHCLYKHVLHVSLG